MKIKHWFQAEKNEFNEYIFKEIQSVDHQINELNNSLITIEYHDAFFYIQAVGKVTQEEVAQIEVDFRRFCREYN